MGSAYRCSSLSRAGSPLDAFGRVDSRSMNLLPRTRRIRPISSIRRTLRANRLRRNAPLCTTATASLHSFINMNIAKAPRMRGFHHLCLRRIARYTDRRKCMNLKRLPFDVRLPRNELHGRSFPIRKSTKSCKARPLVICPCRFRTGPASGPGYVQRSSCSSIRWGTTGIGVHVHLPRAQCRCQFSTCS